MNGQRHPDYERDLILMRTAELLAQAAQDHLARACRPAPRLLYLVGVLLLALGRIVERAGLRLTGQTIEPGVTV